MTQRTQHPVFFIEQGHHAMVHGIEGLNGLPQVLRPARLHRFRHGAPAELFSRAGQILQGARKTPGNEQRRAQHDEVKQDGGEHEPHRQQRITRRQQNSGVQPLAVFQLNGEKHHLQTAHLPFGGLPPVDPLDTGPRVTHGKIGRRQFVRQPLLR